MSRDMAWEEVEDAYFLADFYINAEGLEGAKKRLSKMKKDSNSYNGFLARIEEEETSGRQ